MITFEFILITVLAIAAIQVETGLFFKTDKPDDSPKTYNANLVVPAIALLIVGTIRTTAISYVIGSPLIFCLPCCLCMMCHDDFRGRCLQILLQKPVQRFVSCNCNCPCYRARPKLKFQLQVAYLILACVTRLTAIILCIIKPGDVQAENLAVVISISFIFLIIESFLDYYHYRLWWQYKPKLARATTTMPTTPLSKKHKRYLPYEILGDNRTGGIGDKTCAKHPCTIRELEHILIFHQSDYQPQPRWCELKRQDPTAEIYIGFHRTSADAAISISHTDFRRSTKPQQMLGFGVYFARSIENTLGKARFGGAIIAAEIRMGKVKEVTASEIQTVSNTDSWHPEFDTVYYNHLNPLRDEFCVYDQSQILKWIVVIDEEYDIKVKEYGMDQEYADTKCYCI